MKVLLPVFLDRMNLPVRIREGEKGLSVANVLTLSRFPILLVYILMLYIGDRVVVLLSVPLLFLGLMMDSIGGFIARRLGKASLTGSVLDIVADRVYELVLWVVFSDFRVISIAIPLIVITRTVWTDAIRSIGVQKGEAPFDQHRSRISTFIVRSPWMRSIYGISKIISFAGLTLGIALSEFPKGSKALQSSTTLLHVFNLTSWVAVTLCVVRGTPVIGGILQRTKISTEDTQKNNHDR